MATSFTNVGYEEISAVQNCPRSRGELCGDNGAMANKKSFIPNWYKEEFKEVFNLGWTMVLISFLSNLMGPISVVYCGHLGTAELDGVAIANTVINVTGISIAAGLSTACDTLFSQSFGSRNKKQVGIYLQRSIIIITLFLFPAWAIHMNTETLLVLMGQNYEVARIAGRYLTYFMPGMVAVFMHRILIKYLRTQSIIIPPLVIGFIGAAVNAVMHGVLVYWLMWGTDGSAIAQALAFICMFLATLAYILYSKVYELTWPGWTFEAFEEWGLFLRLAIAGLLMLFLQWLSLEIGTILTGTLGKVEQGAQSILFQIEAINFIIPFGVGIGCNIRVGHLIGAEKPMQAKRAVKVGLSIVLCTSIFMGILLASLHGVLPKIFSSDSQVINYASSLLPIMAIFQFFDGNCGVYGGIMRGLGRQHLGAMAIFFGYFIIGLPIGVCLMYLTDLKVTGLWIGFTIGVAMEAGLYFYFVLVMTDWENEVAKVGSKKTENGISCQKETDQFVILPLQGQARAGLKGAANDEYEEDRMRSVGGTRYSLASTTMTDSDPEDAAICHDEGKGLLLNGNAKHGLLPNGAGHTDGETKISRTWRELVKTRLFWERLGLLALMFSMFAIGLTCRLVYHPKYHHRELVELCQPFRHTFTNHTTTADLANMLVDKKVANTTFEYTVFILDQCVDFLKTYTPPIV
ncbi:multidrug and toxin extrusion protein 1-like isoform X2 [Lineus longissimus]|uniref:multidrug and toxin extrusion protein 1-like isoform X2 n=1 Tax=Lineus longissimus TaxID=88925 RepID=UPI002B4CC6EC